MEKQNQKDLGLVSVLKKTLQDKIIMERVEKITSNENFPNFLPYGMIEIYNKPYKDTLIDSKKLLLGQNGFAKCLFNYRNDGDAPDSGIGVLLFAVPLIGAGAYVFEHALTIWGKIGGGALCAFGGLVGLGMMKEEENEWHSDSKKLSCEDVLTEFPSLTSDRYNSRLKFALNKTNKDFENYKKYNINPNDNFFMKLLTKYNLY